LLFPGVSKLEVKSHFGTKLHQPRCDLSTNHKKESVLEILAQIPFSHANQRLFVDMVLAEVAARERWTPARAAWVVACVK
jgi:hypothetical protein